MIEVKNVTKKYGKSVAVEDISFSINDGEIVGLLGPNGAGKSTTMNILTGYIEQTSGEVTIEGYNTLKKPRKAKKTNRIYARRSASLYRLNCERICDIYGRIKTSK